LVQVDDGRIEALGLRRDGEWILTRKRQADEEDVGVAEL
jgi:hypothetical protein